MHKEDSCNLIGIVRIFTNHEKYSGKNCLQVYVAAATASSPAPVISPARLPSKVPI